jgi:hypothetical protein
MSIQQDGIFTGHVIAHLCMAHQAEFVRHDARTSIATRMRAKGDECALTLRCNASTFECPHRG